MSFLVFRRFLILLTTIVLCSFSFPTLFGGFMNFPKINLGLDLRGGSSILFEIDNKEVISSYLSDYAQKTRVNLRKGNAKFRFIKVENDRVVIGLMNDDDVKKIEENSYFC
jgi:preprotein translocase subunit SecD